MVTFRDDPSDQEGAGPVAKRFLEGQHKFSSQIGPLGDGREPLGKRRKAMAARGGVGSVTLRGGG